MPRPTQKKTIIFQSQFFRCDVCCRECVYLQSSIDLQRAFFGGRRWDLQFLFESFFDSHTDSGPICFPIIDLPIYYCVYLYIVSINVYIIVYIYIYLYIYISCHRQLLYNKPSKKPLQKLLCFHACSRSS